MRPLTVWSLCAAPSSSTLVQVLPVWEALWTITMSPYFSFRGSLGSALVTSTAFWPRAAACDAMHQWHSSIADLNQPEVRRGGAYKLR